MRKNAEFLYIPYAKSINVITEIYFSSLIYLTPHFLLHS
jgi:hypothetical protein